MKNLKFNQKAVIESAKALEDLFLKYAKIDQDAAAAYKQCKPIIDRAKNGEITRITVERVKCGYFGGHFDLADKFPDLLHARSVLNTYLEGWNSEEDFNAYMKEILGE